MAERVVWVWVTWEGGLAQREACCTGQGVATHVVTHEGKTTRALVVRSCMHVGCDPDSGHEDDCMRTSGTAASVVRIV